MGQNNHFRFKQFAVKQEKSAMKVGTDGILLGAWANPKNCAQILDIGTGTGLIALMMAQRSDAWITAVEIDALAAEEAEQNSCNSPWKDRITVYNSSIQNFADSSDFKFDLIVSNPPFFSNSLKAKNDSRTKARHTDSLPFAELIQKVVALLSDDGRFALILPYDSAPEFETLALSSALYLTRKTVIQPHLNKGANRVLFEFSKIKHSVKVDTLTIYEECGRQYSQDFKNLTKDFYLKF